ncbi:MAG: nucleoside recognition domain-containing protein [Thermodesulfobacteriota bacterium]
MARTAKVLIAGNRGVGKTRLFSRLCRNREAAPSSTAPVAWSRIGALRGGRQLLLDTTGSCSLLSRDAEEATVRDHILAEYLRGDLAGILFVADALSLSRSLALALQLMELGLPMALAVNGTAAAAARGLAIDRQELAQSVGCTVLPLTGTPDDLDPLRDLVARLGTLPPPSRRLVTFPRHVETFFALLDKLLPEGLIGSRLLGCLLLGGDQGVRRHLAAVLGEDTAAHLEGLAAACLREGAVPFDILFERLFHQKARQITGRCLRLRAAQADRARRPAAEDICTRPGTGLPIAMLVVCLTYLFVGSFGAGWLADAVHHCLFEEVIIPWTSRLAASIPSVFVREMLVGPDFGIVPNGVALAIGLVMPVIFCFFVAFGLLEDSGYLPRLSVLLDQALQKIGLNGKGVVPLALGFSCVTSAILTTRMLGSEKEKNIAAFLLFLGFPCAPLIAVMFVILGNMPASATFTVFGLIAVQILGVGLLANRIVPGRKTPLLMAMPPLRPPRPGPILRRAVRRTCAFLQEAVPVFMLASFGIFLFDWTGGLATLEHLAAPFLGQLLGLPETSVQVFVKTMIRRESGAAELAHLSASYDNLQLVVHLLVMTLIAPCINASIVLFKERGTRAAVVIMGAVTVYALLAGSVVSHACRFLGITFS